MTPAPNASRPAKAAPRARTPLESRRLQVQVARRQLQMEDDVYRSILRSKGGVDSSTKLDLAGCARVLAHMRSCGFKPAPPKVPTLGRPHNMDSADRGPLLSKIEALLLDANRPWAYAHKMAQQMFKVDRLDFCHEGQLHKIVSALMVNQRRNGGPNT
jgi:phage gp16-like protein